VTTTARRLLGVVLIGALALAACGGDDSDGTPGAAKGQRTGATLHVPGDYATIQAAVDDAEPGDLILVGPGTYKEAVTVETDELTIRGTDRNEVILDGGFELDTGLRVVGADGVAAENMTARNYAAIGFYWTGVEGYRGSYLTSYRTGDYGIYAFDSTKGLIEHSYASGSPGAHRGAHRLPLVAARPSRGRGLRRLRRRGGGGADVGRRRRTAVRHPPAPGSVGLLRDATRGFHHFRCPVCRDRSGRGQDPWLLPACRQLPPAVVDDLVEGAAAGVGDGAQWAVGGVAQHHQIGAEPVVGEAEDASGQLLVAHG
jgi:hypothetical protein